MPKRYALVVTSSELSSLGTSTQQRVSLIRLYHNNIEKGLLRLSEGAPFIDLSD